MDSQNIFEKCDVGQKNTVLNLSLVNPQPNQNNPIPSIALPLQLKLAYINIVIEKKERLCSH